MPINDTTTNRSYQKPNIANTLADDVGRLRSALDAIDADMVSKAPTTGPTFTGVTTVGAGSAAAPSLTFTGATSDTGLYSPGADQVAISTGGTGRLFVDASGRLLVGTSASITASLGGVSQIQLGTTGAYGISAYNFTNDVNGCVLNLGKSRNTSVGSHTVVVNGDALGYIRFDGSDGSKFVLGAAITAEVDGTPGLNDMPGRLVFSTTADGAAAPTERLRITSAGNVGIGTSSPGYKTEIVDASNQLHIGPSQGNTTGLFVNVNTTLFNRSGVLESPDVDGTGGGIVFRIYNNGESTGFYTDNYGNTSIRTTRSGTPFSLRSAGELSFFTSNTERLRIDSSGRLLVGTSTNTNNTRLNQSFAVVSAGNPTYGGASLTNYGGGTNTASPVLDLNRSRGTTDGSMTKVESGDRLGVISFRGADGSAFLDGAAIEAYADGATSVNDLPTRLVFSTTADGAATPTERLRIDSSGRLLVGTSTSVNYGAEPKVQIVDSGIGLSIQRPNNEAIIVLGNSGTVSSLSNLCLLNFTGYDGANYLSAATIRAQVDGTPGTNDMPGRLVFSTTADGAATPTEAMRINNQRELLIGTTTRTANGGVLQISNGITFPGTQSACSDPNTLDDYEEGTFTPIIEGTTTAGAGTYSVQVGRYVKIGKTVTVWIRLTWSAHTGTGNGAIASLPFTSQVISGGHHLFAASVGYETNYDVSANTVLSAYVEPNGTRIFFAQLGVGTQSGAATAALDTAAGVTVTATYETT